MSEWSGILKDLFRQIDDGSISLKDLQVFLEHRNPFEAVGSIEDWKNFYRDTFGIEVDFSELQVPKKEEGFDRLIIVVQGMTPQKLFDKCKELFPCWKWTDENLDEVVSSERTSKNGAYAVWFRDRIEADEELKNLSANNLKEQGINGITLEERLLYKLKYFAETGEHLDIVNITLCSGSRDSGGSVPVVCCWRDELQVNWCSSGVHDGALRSRQAVL